MNRTSSTAFAEAADTIFGLRPEDVLAALESAADALDWLQATFDAVGVLYERGEPSDELRIKHLAEAGSSIAKHASTSAHGSHAVLGLALDAARVRKT